VKATLKEPAMRTSHQNTPETISTIGFDVRKNTFWCNSQRSRHWRAAPRRSVPSLPVTATFWFIGRATIGIMYDVSLPAVIAFCMLTQFAAVPIFVWVGHRNKECGRISNSLPLLHHEHWTRGEMNDSIGAAANNAIIKSRMTAGPDHQQVSLEITRDVDNVPHGMTGDDVSPKFDLRLFGHCA
jgi:hypothetical protein